MTPTQPHCPVLPNPVPLSVNEYSVGQVETNPLTSHPLPLEKIANPATGVTSSVYLDVFGNSACAYPIQVDALDFSSTSLSRQILQPRDWFRAPLFGMPTSLQVGGAEEFHQGSIYDPTSELFFAQDVRGARWYLIGDLANYATFSAGIASFAAYLYESLWNLHPTASPWIDMQEPIYSHTGAPPPPAEARREIDRFLHWLEAFDSELHGETHSILEYSESHPEQPSFDCPNPYFESLYAFYDGPTDRIHLMPIAIGMLQRGEYEGVAQILAHERAHRLSHLNHLVVPSEQLLDHSISRMMGLVVHQGLVPPNMIPGLDRYLRNKIYCQFLPLLPEEEFQAFARELDYSNERSLSPQTHPLQEEAREMSDYMSEILGISFPHEWTQLAAQYVLLARQ